MDVTGTIMMFICKWQAFAWSYQDGDKKNEDLSKEQQEKKLVDLPSLPEYFSYLFFYGSTLVGPFYDYSDYDHFIHKKGNYSKIPSTLVPSFGYLLFAALCMVVIIFIAPDYNPLIIGTEEFADRSMWNKFLYVNIALFVHRIRYYVAWNLGNANVTAVGLNYDSEGKTMAKRFGKIVCVRPIDHELDDNFRDKLEDWNTSCQNWLKYYIYFRVTPVAVARTNPKKGTFASNVTFLVSAVWHGVYPGYYIAFMYCFLCQQLNKYIFKASYKFGFIPPVIRTILGCVLSTIGINFSATNFVLLEFSKTMLFASAFHYIPTTLLIGSIIFFATTGWGQKSRKVKEN